jgi:hypothetical protein
MKKLAIYIKSSVSEFAETLTVDNTYILVDNTFITADETLYNGELITKDIYNRIELFNDETVSITSSVQNVSDISKIFTDYSQSFTIPASKRNNKIFKHWYESSIDDGYDARIKYDAYIELDTIPFRKGVIQLEKATLKNGVPENYTITFYGILVSLKDKFAEKKLFDLDFSDYNFEYTGSDVVDRVSGDVTSDIKFPLITSNRLWSDSGSTDNITTSGGAILTNELFPAIRLNKIFDAIETNYNITFDGSFLTDERFTNAFLWLKNAETFSAKSTPTKLTFPTSVDFPVASRWYLGSSLNYVQPAIFKNSFVELTVTTSNLNINYSILVNRNGTLLYTIPVNDKSIGTNSFNVLTFTNDVPSNVGSYEFYLQSESPMTFSTSLEVSVVTFDSGIASNSSQSTSGVVNISSYMPDIKVEDFFSGILKTFNLTCLSYEEDVYEIQELESWYSSGTIRDITPYVVSDDITIEKLPSFKKINFKHEKSESLLNVAFKSNSGTEYGDLLAEIESDGGEYTIQVPFENLLFSKFSGQNLQVGYVIKQDLKNYQPKPILLYDYGTLQSCNFYLKYDSTTVNLTTYNCFGQDTLIDGINYSLNFGSEISSLLLTPIDNSLYNVYYSNYITNIYNKKARKYSVKCVFSISLTTNIKLNDRVVIRDKRYIIDNIVFNLTNDEVNLTLINDFRTL